MDALLKTNGLLEPEREWPYRSGSSGKKEAIQGSRSGHGSEL
jgi:hypothetical protein